MPSRFKGLFRRTVKTIITSDVITRADICVTRLPISSNGNSAHEVQEIVYKLNTDLFVSFAWGTSNVVAIGVTCERSKESRLENYTRHRTSVAIAISKCHEMIKARLLLEIS